MSAVRHHTTCSRDCPDACGIVAEVENGRVTSLKGDPEHPVTAGFLCFRTSRFLEHQNGAERLRQPLLRESGELRPVSMECALDVAAEKLLAIRDESGPAAIMHYRSGGSLGILKGLTCRFFEDFGPCATKIGDICSGAGEAAQEADFGICDSNDLFDLENSRHILVWGKNPTISSVHTVPVLKAARAGGARILLIDPVHHKTAGFADRVLQPRPGADLELALAVARLLFERGEVDPRVAEFCENLSAFRALALRRSVADYAAAADLPEAEIAALADSLADGPTAILVGWGLQRRRRGAATIRALDALSAISGNLFVHGGGCSFYYKRKAPFVPFERGAKVAPRTLREPLLGQDLLAAKDPPIRMIWVTAANPVAMLPEARLVAEAFERTEFTVVVDPFLTDTGRRADLVIPAPTLLEDADLVGGYGHHWLGESRPVVPPPDGVLHEALLFQALAGRVGLDAYPRGSVDELKRMALAELEAVGVGLDALRRGPVRRPDVGPVLFPDGVVKTPSGKVRLMTEVPDYEPPLDPPAGDGSAPLWLFSNSTEKSQASQWAGRGLGEHTWIAVHPDAVPGLGEGQIVVVVGPGGQLRAELRFDPRQRRDAALMPKGGHYDRGHSANVLIPARPTDLGLGASFLDVRVRIREA